jgi:sugar phosphate isomerase/epimerase
MRRRTFLQAAGAAAITAAWGEGVDASPNTNPYLKTIGLQLWTVRNQLKEDLSKTLKAVSEAGYYQVELMRTLDAEPVLAAAKDNGLCVSSAFIDWRTIAQAGKKGVPTFDTILEAAVKHGFRYLVFGYVGKGSRETADQLKVLAERANKAGEKCRAADIQFCYHNHAFEFEKLPGGKSGFEVFQEEFDRELVKFELDVFWAAIGGWDPVKTLLDLKGRVAQVHLKDLAPGYGTIYDESKVPHDAFREVGSGTIDMKAVLKAAQATGVAQCHVEQDQSPDPIKSIAQSVKYLRRL